MDTNKLIALLPDLATFVSVVENGSFTLAAEHLGITPSGISRQITRLERELATTLLQRTTRKQSLTESGMEVYQHALSILNSAREVANIAQRDAEQLEGTIRIAAPKAFCKNELYPHLLAFIQQYPKIKLQVMVRDKPSEPISDQVDIVFSITSTPQEHLVAKKISHARSILCASPDYLQRYGLPKTPDELVQHNCLYLGENRDDNHWYFSKDGVLMDVIVSGPLAINHSELRLDAALKGMGIALLPDFTCREPLLSGSLVEVLNDWSIRGPYQGCVYIQFIQTTNLPRKLRTFIDFISDKFSV
ncbi:LysR family transcriptional regulator [Vibrio sp.]|uniref:LysR family transcriptional regulator n=1 Tax=Vibrio viridaestus TaxID=2487322 RepID=A0A3N9TDQ1_9VIBR|nr:LysR family transcriptional regulator [Vibrio viridaestus]MDC0609164.1 LysR family transcriptional regulator [Vibrio sp.]RQW62321.1 LysR family transcriptional regulator [Vibrio viridaestus]